MIEDWFNVFIFDTDDFDVDSEASPNLSAGIKFTVICFCLFWHLSVTSTGDRYVYHYSYENKVALLLDLQLKRFYENIYKTHMLGLSTVFVSNL